MYGRSITLATVQFFFLFFLIFQFRQFNCHNSIFIFIFDNIIAEIIFLSPTSVTSFLSPLSYFFSEFQQWCYRNSFLSSFCQISLNSTHITNKHHFFTIFSQKTHQIDTRIPILSRLKYQSIYFSHFILF